MDVKGVRLVAIRSALVNLGIAESMEGEGMEGVVKGAIFCLSNSIRAYTNREVVSDLESLESLLEVALGEWGENREEDKRRLCVIYKEGEVIYDMLKPYGVMILRCGNGGMESRVVVPYPGE